MNFIKGKESVISIERQSCEIMKETLDKRSAKATHNNYQFPQYFVKRGNQNNGNQRQNHNDNLGKESYWKS